MLNNRVILLVLVLASIQFNAIAAIPESIRNAMQMLVFIVPLAFIILNTIYFKIPFTIKRNFSVEIFLFLASAFISMFGAYAWHNQSFSTTIIAQRFMYVYLFYFFLHLIKPSNEDIIQVIVIIGFFSFVMYLLQYFVFPKKILDCRVSLDRGTVRIFLPGYFYLTFAYYICLLKYFHSKKILHIILAATLFIIFILMGTRQIIAIVGLLSLIAILKSKVLNNKFLILFAAGLAGLATFYIFQDLFIEMMAVTESQVGAEKEDVRIRATKYFIYDFFPNRLSYIVGNGAESLNSPYGVQINFLKSYYGYYQSDIGIIGDYSKFGVLYVLTVLIIVIKVFVTKLPEMFSFIKLVFAGVVLGSVTGGFPFGQPGAILSFVILLYLVDLNKKGKKEDSSVPITEGSSNN